MELKNYLINVKEYLQICDTSPQIREVKYDPYQDNFMIETKDNYKVYFKVRKEN
jgi:glutaredoxin-related protein